MADTTKLADTFEAWRIVFSVSIENMVSAFSACRQLGLGELRIIGFMSDLKRVKAQVNVPIPPGASVCFTHDLIKIAMRAMRGMEMLSTKVTLICPPELETKTTQAQPCDWDKHEYEYDAQCIVCQRRHPVVGPYRFYSASNTFVMARHEQNGRLCYGTMLPAVGGSRNKIDKSSTASG